METFNKETPDIPTLKEKEKERKGGAVVVGQTGGSPGLLYRWFGIGGQGAAGGAARVGAGVASKAGSVASAGKIAAGAAVAASPKYGLVPTLINFVSSNIGMAALSMALTGGAVYTLYTLGMNSTRSNDGQARVFAKRDRGAPEIGPADDARVDASGLSYFQTANTGLGTGEGDEGVSDTVEELNDAAMEEGAAEEELESADEAVEEASGGAPDLAEEMTKKQKSKFKLAKAMAGRSAGSGLKGSAGMSGGFSQPFQKTTRLKKAQEGTIAPVKKRKGGKLTARRMSSANRAGKGAMNQLKFSSKKSRMGALGATTEGAAFQAAEAFSAAPIGAASKGIAGGGLSSGGDGITPSSDGGPIGNNTVNPEQDAPDTGDGKDKSPWTQSVMMAMALLTTASTIIAVIGMLAMIDKIVMGMLQPVMQMLLGIATGMAAASTAMGVQIMTEYGQKEQGMILTTGGAITTATGIAALVWPQMPAWLAVLGGVAGIAASVGALLAGGGMGGM